MRSHTMSVLTISVLLGHLLFAQTITSNNSTTKAYCSPAVSGTSNNIVIKCDGISQKQADQLLRIVNKISQNQLSADQVFDELDEIERAVNVLADDPLFNSQLKIRVVFQVNPSEAVTSFLNRIAKDFPEVKVNSVAVPIGHPAFPQSKEGAELPLERVADRTAIGLWAFKNPSSDNNRMNQHESDFWILDDCAFEPVRRTSNKNDQFQFFILSDNRVIGDCYSLQPVVYRNNPRLRGFSDLEGCELYLSFSPNSPPVTPEKIDLINNGRVLELSHFKPVSGQYNVFSTVVSSADLEPPH
jgi:hypothetical protein